MNQLLTQSRIILDKMSHLLARITIIMKTQKNDPFVDLNRITFDKMNHLLTHSRIIMNRRENDPLINQIRIIFDKKRLNIERK